MIFSVGGNESYYQCNECYTRFYPRSRHKMLNMEEMYERMCATEKQVAILAKNIKDLSERFNELYFAPGMPGCHLAKKDFYQAINTHSL
jgi:hypothetical protein